ncbi:phosphatidylinositol-glycan biosynthesis class H protein [Cryptosporidium andersoni]|uniref:Phosphatidylinositol-glycan biosynthesis class H protein n=1 Tax=Cryptosporidium andersoni TaxID=117008 RepID=A0A1J4M9V1_9CRYT|nr:phosphatidylinositol-glycan biosynthesis class H protein [Cryptosporidium andersoni]
MQFINEFYYSSNYSYNINKNLDHYKVWSLYSNNYILQILYYDNIGIQVTVSSKKSIQVKTLYAFNSEIIPFIDKTRIKSVLINEGITYTEIFNYICNISLLFIIVFSNFNFINFKIIKYYKNKDIK